MKWNAAGAALAALFMTWGDPVWAQAARIDTGLRTTASESVEVVRFRGGGFRAGGFRGGGFRAGGMRGGRFHGVAGARGRGVYRGGYAARGGAYRYGGAWRGGRYGYGVGAGVAAGALVGGAAVASQAAPAYGGSSYCASRYRSYDPQSGTYLSNDGSRRPCP
jgi:hypothetical protein